MEFAGLVHRNCYCEKRNADTFFVALRMLSEENAPKKGEPTVDLSSMTMLQHTDRYWSRIS
jgi:hypothetical protein